jgi:hypothetical protein
MANKKKYRIYCNTEVAQVEGYSILDTPPDLCPNNAAHSIIADTKVIVEIIFLDNLFATVAPTVSDDINAGYGINSRWLWGTNLWVCTDNTSGAAVWTRIVTGLFGTESCYAYSESESSTTSNTYQQKLRLSIPAIPAGTYRIGWNYLSKESNRAEYKIQVQLDDTIVLMEEIPSYYYASYKQTGGFGYADLTAATHFIDLDYACNNAGGTTYVKCSHLELWRVG